MGNALKPAAEVQRRANKAFTDPNTWKKTVNTDEKTATFLMSQNQYNPGAGANAVRELSAGAHIDAEEYYSKMNEIEQEHASKSKLAPGEVTNAMRMELFQQRQYLSYKDTMLRMGVPADSVLPLHKWAETHDAPIEMDLKEAYQSMADRVHSFEMTTPTVRDPSDHDTFATVEEGDNRLTERMLQELMELKSEGKLDHDTAGNELHRDAEVLRRITSSIRTVPPTTHFDPNVDAETLFHLNMTGRTDEQRAAHTRGLKHLFRSPDMQAQGWNPEYIPARGFRPPEAARSSNLGKEKQFAAPQSGVAHEGAHSTTL